MCKFQKYYFSLSIRKPTICICETKGADQLCSNWLCSNCTADQRLCFCYTYSTIPVLLKSKNFKLLAIFFDCTDRLSNDVQPQIKKLNAVIPLNIRLCIKWNMKNFSAFNYTSRAHKGSKVGEEHRVRLALEAHQYVLHSCMASIRNLLCNIKNILLIWSNNCGEKYFNSFIFAQNMD